MTSKCAHTPFSHRAIEKVPLPIMMKWLVSHSLYFSFIHCLNVTSRADSFSVIISLLVMSPSFEHTRLALSLLLIYQASCISCKMYWDSLLQIVYCFDFRKSTFKSFKFVGGCIWMQFYSSSLMKVVYAAWPPFILLWCTTPYPLQKT